MEMMTALAGLSGSKKKSEHSRPGCTSAGGILVATAISGSQTASEPVICTSALWIAASYDLTVPLLRTAISSP
jgi:hypothetical protein